MVIYLSGDFDSDQMFRSRVTRQDVEARMRDSGVQDLAHVETIVVDRNDGSTLGELP